MLKTAFDSVVDLTSPIEIFNHSFQETDMVEFLCEETWDGVLKPVVQEQLEKFAIPVEEFEDILRQEIIATNPELVAECESRGLAVTVADDAFVDEATALMPTLSKDELVLSGVIKELEAAVAAAASTGEFNDNQAEEVRRSVGSSREAFSFTPSLKQAGDIHSQAPLETLIFDPPVVTPFSLSKELNNVDFSVAETPSSTNSSTSTARHSSNQDDDRSLTLADGETIVYVDDLDNFAFHFAVHSSQGDLEAFLDLTEVVDAVTDDPNAVMQVQRIRVEESTRLIDATEYALLRGYREVGAALVCAMKERGVPVPDPTLFTSSSQVSVTFSEDVEEFPFIFAAHESRGDLREYELLASIIDAEHDAIDARIRANIIQRTEIANETWSAVELACHCGYVDIVKHLLTTKRVKTASKSIVVMRRAMLRAKELSG